MVFAAVMVMQDSMRWRLCYGVREETEDVQIVDTLLSSLKSRRSKNRCTGG
jgi:hypothetical protein